MTGFDFRGFFGSGEVLDENKTTTVQIAVVVRKRMELKNFI